MSDRRLAGGSDFSPGDSFSVGSPEDLSRNRDI
jgi:hypothetical protein